MNILPHFGLPAQNAYFSVQNTYFSASFAQNTFYLSSLKFLEGIFTPELVGNTLRRRGLLTIIWLHKGIIFVDNNLTEIARSILLCVTLHRLRSMMP